MMTSTDLLVPEVSARAPMTAPAPTARRSRVWRAPRPASAIDAPPHRTPGRYVAGALTAALIAGGALGLARLDDGPRGDTVAPDRSPGSMYSVVDQIGARELWDAGITGTGVNVAIIDTGIAPVPALTDPGKVVAAVDFSDERNDPALAGRDGFGHGTHLAGIIAGRDAEFLGVAPNAGIVSVKVAGRDGAVSQAQMVAAVDWVVANADALQIDVLTVAFDSGLGTSHDTDPLAAALDRAWDAGIVVVTAAGNRGPDAAGLDSPASDPRLIAVGGVEATTTGFTVPEWASSGDGMRNPDVAAPGAHIRSLRAPGSTADTEHPEGFVDDARFLGSGSSQSAAVTAGAVALLLSAHPELSPDEVKQVLVASATPVDASATIVGAGVLDIAAAAEATPADATPGVPAASAVDTKIVADPSWTGSSWTGSSWTGSSWTGSSWTGSSWTGSSWTGSSWTGSSWTGSSWTGSSWTGSSWTGSSWTGSSWTGSSWTGSSWTGSSWTGSSWTGSSWTGSSWTGSSWTGSSWTGSSWTGSSWTGSSWTGSSWTGSSWTGSSWTGSSWTGSSWT
jgi:serine protease AprX